MSARSRALATQALIAGRVRLDGAVLPAGIADGPVRAPLTVRLIDRGHADEPEVGLPVAVTRDGRFAFFGDPDTAFPRLATTPAALRVDVSAPHHEPTSVDVDLAAAPGQPAEVDVPVPVDSPTSIRLYTGGGLPRADLDLVLSPRPVRLEGRVEVSNEPGVGVAAATLTLGVDVANSDAAGRFVFPDPLPLMHQAEITVTAPGFIERAVMHPIDYDQDVNRLVVLLRRA